MRKWLVVDVPYMCHRAWHTMPDLSWKGKATGVVFQFLRSITVLKDQFATDRIAFCFDSKHLFRRDIYPAYKANRHTHQDWTPAQRKAYGDLRSQIDRLYEDYLPEIGFANVFRVDGLESDDLMAHLVLRCADEDEMVLITSDSDLFQCLEDNVTIYSPQKQKEFTKDWFYGHYGIWPAQWAMVKSLAGCSTDGVKGIEGIGEKTALKYVQGKLPLKSKAHQRITSPRGWNTILCNHRLVSLPFNSKPFDSELPELREDRITAAGWARVCGRLGMKSIAGRPPVATRRQSLIR